MGSILSSITDFLSSSINSSQQPKKTNIFSKYQSKLEIKNVVERQLNQFISDQLPNYYLYTATLKSLPDSTIEFSYIDHNGQQQHYRFANESVLNKWLIDHPKVDIWEIEDHRQEKPTITYKLQKEGEWGFDEFTTDQQLFEHLNDHSGPIWKVVNHQHPVYIHAHKEWFGNITFKQKNLEDLACFLKTPLTPLPTLDGRKLKNIFVAILAFSACDKLIDQFSSLDLSRMALVGLTTHSIAMKNGIANSMIPVGFSVLSEFVSTARGQTLTVPSPLNIQVNPGDQLNLSLSSYFSLPTDKMIGFYSNTTSFLTLNNAPQHVQTINVTGNVQAVTVSGNILHTFGDSYQTLNLSNPIPQVLDTYGSNLGIRDRVMHQNCAHLAAGSNGYIVVNATNPANLAMIAQIPAASSVNAIAIDSARSIIWLGDGSTVKSVNIANPASPVVLNTVSSNIFHVLGIGLSGNNNNRMNVLSIQNGTIYGRLTSFNATNPANINYVGLYGSIFTVTDPLIGDIACSTSLCYPGMLNFYSCNMVGASPACFQATGLSAAYVNKMVLKDQVLYVALGNSPFVYTIDTSSPFALKFYKVWPVNATATNSVFPHNDLVYVASPNEVNVYQFKASGVTISGVPTLAQRGNYNFNVTATNFTGGTSTLNIQLEVMNQGPVVANPIPTLSAIVNNFFYYAVPNNTFSDADDPVDSLVWTFDPRGLPLVFNNASKTIQGTPIIVGDFNMSMTAVDPLGKSVLANILLQVALTGTTNSPGTTPPTGTTAATTVSPNPSSSSISNQPITTMMVSSSGGSNNTTGIVVGILVGGVLIAVIIGGTIYVLKRKGVFAKKDEFKLSPVISKKTLTTTFGGGNYGTLNWTPEEVEACYKETGLIPELGTGKIGSGHFGAVSICWDIRNSRYAVMKVVDDPKKFQASIAEAELQKKAAGEGVWSIYNYIQDDETNRLVLLFPPAGLKDLNDVSQRIKDKGVDNKRELIATFMAKDLLNGLNRLRDKKIGHFDLKGTNVLVGKDGETGISDFGCAQQTDKEFVTNVTSDKDYKSPEQVDSGKIYSKHEDLWAAGLMILEFLLGKSASEFINIDIYKQKKQQLTSFTYRQYVEEKLAQIDELRAPIEGSIFHVVKTLLSTDPSKRGTPAEVLKLKCFSELDPSQKVELFGSLLPEFSNRQEQQMPAKQGIDFRRSRYENIANTSMYENV